MSERADLASASPHRFGECPDCGAATEYPTQSDVICTECGGEFCHEIRGERHLLWRFDGDYQLDEVVARV